MRGSHLADLVSLCRVYTGYIYPGYKLYPLISLVAVYIVSCIGDKIVVTVTCIHLYPRVEHCLELVPFYSVSQKTRHYTLVHSFVKYWPNCVLVSGYMSCKRGFTVLRWRCVDSNVERRCLARLRSAVVSARQPSTVNGNRRGVGGSRGRCRSCSAAPTSTNREEAHPGHAEGRQVLTGLTIRIFFSQLWLYLRVPCPCFPLLWGKYKSTPRNITCSNSIPILLILDTVYATTWFPILF